MKLFITLFSVCAFLSACTSLTRQETQTLRSLDAHGISVDYPAGNWEKPSSPAAAGALNLILGGENFYLASGNGTQSEHFTYGFLNLLTWPISIIWGVPEAAIDANTINQRELIYFYTFDPQGQAALKERNLQINNQGMVTEIK